MLGNAAQIRGVAQVPALVCYSLDPYASLETTSTLSYARSLSLVLVACLGGLLWSLQIWHPRRGAEEMTKIPMTLIQWRPIVSAESLPLSTPG